MKTLTFAHLAILIAALLGPLSLTAQNETTTAEEAAMDAAEEAMFDANTADNDANAAEAAAADSGRDVDKDRARILRERADEAMKKAAEAIKKADGLLDGIPAGMHFHWLQHRLDMLLRLFEACGYTPPDTKNETDFSSLPAAAAQQQQRAIDPALAAKSTTAQSLANALLGRMLVGLEGTGETIGDVAIAKLKNPTANTIAGAIPATVLISGSGQYQPYVLPKAVPFVVGPGAEKSVPLDGVCMDARRPPVTPQNKGELIMLDPAGEGFPKSLAEQIAGAQRLTQAVADLQKKGSLTTPFSGNPEKEREAVIQQTFWIYTSALAGRPYTKAEFANKLYGQAGFQPPNAIDPAVAGSPKTLPSGAVVTPDPVITKPSPTILQGVKAPDPNSQQPITMELKSTIILDPKSLAPIQPLPGSVVPDGPGVKAPVIGNYTLPPPPMPKAGDLKFNLKTGNSPPTHPSGAVITPDPQPLKQPTAAQQQKLDQGIDQFWEAFQLTGKEAKVL